MENSRDKKIPLRQFDRALEQVEAFRPSKPPFVIGVAGGSCSGKTSFCNQLIHESSGKITLFSLDHYYLGKSEMGSLTFDEPEALDWPLMIGQLRSLISGLGIDQPVYDFSTHSRIGTQPLQAADTILVEGLFALHPPIRPLLHLGIYVEAPIHTAWMRRRARDVEERGRTPEDIDRQFREEVAPMFLKHVAWQQNQADIVIDNP
jgi:uridine kinase